MREAHHPEFDVLEFETVIQGKSVNSVDTITWNADGLITEIKVMVRPLQGLNALHTLMGEKLLELQSQF